MSNILISEGKQSIEYLEKEQKRALPKKTTKRGHWTTGRICAARIDLVHGPRHKTTTNNI